MRNFAEKKLVQKTKTSFPENPAVCEIMWKRCGRARQDKHDSIKRRMRIACWIYKAADTQNM
jgi:hypothetical protein